ncbi:MAG: hypothetical protein BroJett040_10120 [Oligoflexia bacterium]|nr:MAG: hypothetical protein BroJett040_10120 [Oligoflexia bacterium]
MDKRKPCAFEAVLDNTLGDLQLDLEAAKHIHPTGIRYAFLWDSHAIDICIPSTSNSTYSNIFRVAAEVCETTETDASALLYRIAFYLHVNDRAPIRIVPKPTSRNTVKLLLEIVGDVNLFQPEFIAATLIHMAELVGEIRSEMIDVSQDKAV